MFSEEERQQLRAIARRAIKEGLGTRRQWTPDLGSVAPILREPGASFVTLHHSGDLRGCIGSLAPDFPLAEDVAHNAFRSAFQDPRFAPVSPSEFEGLAIAISVLSPFLPLAVMSEQDLLNQLIPGRHGLYLDSDDGRATFLPDVWKTLPEAKRFITELKRKAGLSPSYPTEKIRWSVYQTEKV